MPDDREAAPSDAPPHDATLPPLLRAHVTGYEATRASPGASGAVVHRLHAPGRPTLYLKTGAGHMARAIADECARLAWLGGRAAAPTVVAFAQNADASYLLTSAVSGATAYERLATHDADAESIATTLGRHLRTLHAIAVTECPFDAAPAIRLAEAHGNVAAGLVDDTDFDRDHAGMAPAQLYAAMLALLPLPFERVVTHGDYSLDNVLLDGDRVTGCVDWGRAGVSDPWQDLAIAWRDLGEFGASVQRSFLRGYGLTAPDERRLAFFRCLDEFF